MCMEDHTPTEEPYYLLYIIYCAANTAEGLSYTLSKEIKEFDFLSILRSFKAI